MLALEGRILHAAQIGRAAGTGLVAAETLDRALASERIPLGTDQHDALRTVTSQGRRLEVLVGAAGTGKTTMLIVGTRAWKRRATRSSASPTPPAADVLRSEADMPAETVAKFFDWHDHCDAPAGWVLTPRHVVAVDEAGMLATRDLDRLVELAGRHGVKLVLVGDHHQLGANRVPGGMFAALADTLGAVELHEAHRFTQPWEAHALALLVAGTVAASRRSRYGPRLRRP